MAAAARCCSLPPAHKQPRQKSGEMTAYHVQPSERVWQQGGCQRRRTMGRRAPSSDSPTMPCCAAVAPGALPLGSGSLPLREKRTMPGKPLPPKSLQPRQGSHRNCGSSEIASERSAAGRGQAGSSRLTLELQAGSLHCCHRSLCNWRMLFARQCVIATLDNLPRWQPSQTAQRNTQERKVLWCCGAVVLWRGTSQSSVTTSRS